MLNRVRSGLRALVLSSIASASCLAFAQAPESRGHFALAYDGAAKKVVMTGGAAFFGGKMALFDDVWSWDGTKWQRQGNSGLAVMGARMIYQQSHNRLVMLAGIVGKSQSTGDFRALVRNTWITLSTANELKGVDPGVAIDSKRGRLVAFIPGPDGGDPKVYEWDDRVWRIGKGNPPKGHEGVAMAYDEKRGVVVAFGGHGVDKKHSSDLWEYDGLKWQLVGGAGGPIGRSYPGMVYDDKLGAVVIHGGMGQGAKWLSDTWAWDGTAWKQLSDKGPALELSMAYDQSRDRLVVVGTDSHENTTAKMQTWEWDGATWTKLSG